MTGASDKAVSDYLDTLFLDNSLPPVDVVREYQALDSIDTGCRLLPCDDVFQLMSMTNVTKNEIWEGFLQLLVLGAQLPEGRVQTYIFNQSQVLYYKAQLKSVC